ncbi:hypothetical protein LTR36_006285 [Oleoguttula mirabilis]|uniref:Uncharacterized protein n=1 Tax=Oleoguttula mirabilis TaxID=1507867 RepID=A0AAV9JC98_9PEZI|nr:hypothetical protein LTR36_006285 [Oleoguttula mirabilis]
MVYDQLLQPSKLTILSYDTPSLAGLCMDEIAKTRFYALQPRESLSPLIRQVCHQIDEEAAAILYSPSYLELRPSSANVRQDNTTTDRHINVLRIRFTRPLEKLRIEIVTTPPTIKEDKSHSRCLLNVMAKGVFAKRVLLVVRVFHIYAPDDSEPVLNGLAAVSGEVWEDYDATRELQADVGDEISRRRTEVVEEVQAAFGRMVALGGSEAHDFGAFSDEEDQDSEEQQDEDEEDNEFPDSEDDDVTEEADEAYTKCMHGQIMLGRLYRTFSACDWCT